MNVLYKKYIGFSLIEILLVVAVLALLTLFGYTSYSSHVLKSHRVDVTMSLAQDQLLLEQCYFQNGSYDSDCLSKIVYPHVSKMGFYQIVLETLGADQYRLSALPMGAQSKDMACNKWTITHANERTAFNAFGELNTNCWG